MSVILPGCLWKNVTFHGFVNWLSDGYWPLRVKWYGYRTVFSWNLSYIWFYWSEFWRCEGKHSFSRNLDFKNAAVDTWSNEKIIVQIGNNNHGNNLVKFWKIFTLLFLSICIIKLASQLIKINNNLYFIQGTVKFGINGCVSVNNV